MLLYHSLWKYQNSSCQKLALLNIWKEVSFNHLILKLRYCNYLHYFEKISTIFHLWSILIRHGNDQCLFIKSKIGNWFCLNFAHIFTILSLVLLIYKKSLKKQMWLCLPLRRPLACARHNCTGFLRITLLKPELGSFLFLNSNLTNMALILPKFMSLKCFSRRSLSFAGGNQLEERFLNSFLLLSFLEDPNVNSMIKSLL